MADMGAAGFDPTDGGLNVHMKNSSGGGGGAATIADGADIAEGATTNTAVTGDNTGTISAKLRGLNKLFADVWDNVNHWLQVKVMNSVALGQAPSTSSMPVVLPTDQTAIPVKRSAVAVYSLASTATSGATQNSGDLDVSFLSEISIDINITADGGTSPTIQYIYERKGLADGLYYPLWQSDILTAVPSNPISTSVGPGTAYNQSLASKGRLRWVVGGSATPNWTHSINISGK